MIIVPINYIPDNMILDYVEISTFIIYFRHKNTSCPINIGIMLTIVQGALR